MLMNKIHMPLTSGHHLSEYHDGYFTTLAYISDSDLKVLNVD